MSIPDPDRRRWFVLMPRQTGKRRMVADPVTVAALRQAELAAPLHYGRPDLLQRTLLCRATNQHDPRPDGTCRDCERPVTASDPVCAPEVLIHAQPDEEQP